MPKYCLFLFFSICCFVQQAVAETVATGLEIDNAHQLNVVYTIEPKNIDIERIKTMFAERLLEANIEQAQRDDAQLFLRVEQHTGEYLLYLDFSRKVHYMAGGKSYQKDGFVWGRYVKDISDVDELYDDIQFLMDEFIEAYTQANCLNKRSD